ncbi:MAG: DUF2220 family protein [Deltaproteobacteria bacterium]|nr:DUF2220 family protein [Deltaproteobacteria bacterium]
MKEGPVESLRAQLSRDGALRTVMAAILDRCDSRGALPKQMILRCGSREERDAAVRLLSAAAVRASNDREMCVRLDLARADERLRSEGSPGLSEVLYAAAGRPPRNLRAENASLAEQAASRASELAAQHAGAAAAFLMTEAEKLAGCRGEMFALARDDGLARVERELAVAARCMELAEKNEQPVRLANFARRATGSTKGLRAGDRRYVRVADALLRYVPGLVEKVDAEGLREPGDRRRLALECLGVFRNETPIDVLCYGRFILQKHGRRIDAPSAHHDLGEPCRLLLLHLRDAQVADMRAERVVSIENETTFNDYIEWLRASGRDEIVLLSEGQANWAVVRLLGLLASAAPSVPIVHWGDLDRFGVLILRSLRRRSGLAIDPLWMDVAIFQRFVNEGLPLTESESEEIRSLVTMSPAEVGVDLLRAIREAGRWVEQELVAEGVLGLRSGSGGYASGIPSVSNA